jgi:hypothetical protein
VEGDANTEIATLVESYSPAKAYDPANLPPNVPDGSYSPLRAGPYPAGTQPNVFFRLDAPVDAQARLAYERAQTPWETDLLNTAHIADPASLKFSPLGDPIPFSAHLIGQLVNDTGYSTQFNLDSDRAFAYLTWDWIRGDETKTGILGQSYALPVEPPEGAGNWQRGLKPLQLKYVDAPRTVATPRVGPRIDAPVARKPKVRGRPK